MRPGTSKPLAFNRMAPHPESMEMPQSAVTLAAAEVEELNRKLADLRHNINNCLSLIIASAEMVGRKPDSAPRMIANIIEQPQRIVEELQRFSGEFEKALGIKRSP